MYCVSQRGIFTRPMSSPIGWCVHVSAIEHAVPAASRSMASVPLTCSARSPWKRAIRIENDVIGTPGGTSAATLRNACESVTTSAGGFEPPERPREFAVLVTSTGSRRRGGRESPSPAAGSAGPSAPPCRWGQRGRRSRLAGPGRPRCGGCRNDRPGPAAAGPRADSPTPSPVNADSATSAPPAAPAARARRPPAAAQSVLLTATMTGTLRAASSATRPSSNAPHEPASVTTTPMSTRSRTARVSLHPQLAERALVVHAGRVDEEDRAQRQQFHGLLDRVGRRAGDGRDDGHLWRVIALSSDDLPTLRRPNRPMWRRSAFGAACISALFSGTPGAAP